MKRIKRSDNHSDQNSSGNLSKLREVTNKLRKDSVRSKPTAHTDRQFDLIYSKEKIQSYKMLEISLSSATSPEPKKHERGSLIDKLK